MLHSTSRTTGERRTIVMPRKRPPPAATEPHIGDQLGRYRLCLELATGGMGTVYLARVVGGVGAQRFVALKCLKERLASDARFVDMFFDEARITSQIDHPNVCRVLDYDRHGNTSYLVMELLLGHSMSTIRPQLDAEQHVAPAHHAGLVARILADACEGMHAAHELTDLHGNPLNVVHRDVSPENLFLTYGGAVKVLDFGIARADDQRHSTRPGTIKGKYAYLQPEVLRGARPDRRADVWGLGIILWELLAGRRLFEQPTDAETLRAVTDMEIPRPSQVRDGVPEAFDDVCLQALHRDPSRRIQTARELGRQLNRVLADQRLAIGMAEVADLMKLLFPSGPACARQLLDTVERMGDAGEPARDDDGDAPTILAAGSRPGRERPDADESSILIVADDAADEPERQPQRRRLSTRLLALIAGCVLLAAVALTHGLTRAMSDRRADPAPPTVAAPAPPSYRVELEPVRLPSGEIVLRLGAAPTADDTVCPPP